MLDIFILYLHLSGLNPDLNQTALFSWNQYSISIILNFSSDAEASEARTKVLASDADNVRRKIWWAQEDSNLRPHAYQACALTTWATSPFDFRRPVVVSVFRRPVVEMRRIELLTPCLQGRCSPSWATPPYFNLSIDAGTSEFVFLFSTFEGTQSFDCTL